MNNTLEKTKYAFDSKEHLHTLNGRPLTGTSSISNVLAKPLTYWASGLAVEQFGWLNPKKHTPEECLVACENGMAKVKKLERDEYAKLLDRAYRAHATTLKEKAKEGTDLHFTLERYVKNTMLSRMPTPMYDEKIKPFIDWAGDNVKQFLASEANCFSERLWLGGVIDAVAELNDGSLAIIDFKSSKEAYPGQFLQACLYAIQINENGLWDSKGEHSKKLDKPIDKLIIVPFGAEKIEPEIRNAKDYVAGAEAAVTLYRMLGFEERTKENNKLNN